MNLERAKFILIIAFACLNLFLGYHLFWPDFGRLTQVAVSAEDLRQLDLLLNQNNYYLENSIDRSVQTGIFMTVSTSLEFRRQVLLKFLQEGAQFSNTEDGTYYRKDDKTAIIQSTGLITVIYTPPIETDENLAESEQRELRSYIEHFLREQHLMPEGAVFDYLEATETGEVILRYYQAVDDCPVFAGHLRVTTEEASIKSVEIYWLNPIESEPSREMEVITAAAALANFVRDMGPSTEPQFITDVSLGYFSGEYDAEKWEIPPVWRILLQEGQIYYINAFTGNIEQESVIPEQLP
ncbi:MAG: two-component system regulatory protein YycI [Bacillota bacterium]|nr:two-component system regulatory protein YycI [Bacillota bacterium]